MPAPSSRLETSRTISSSFCIRSKLPQKPHIILVEQPDVADPVANHGNAFDAEAERPAGPDFRIVADVFENFRVHHAAAGDFEPVLAHFLHQRAREIDFKTRFRVTEIVRTKTDFHILAHSFLEHKFDGAFQVSGGHAFVHVEAFHLLESRIVRGISVVTAINAARDDDANGRLLLLHHADLHRGSMSAEKSTLALTPALSPRRGGSCSSAGCKL